MRNYFNLRFSLFCAISLCLGILSAKLFVCDKTLYAVLILALGVLIPFLTLFLRSGERFKVKAIIFIVLASLVFVGLFRMGTTFNRYEKANLDCHYYFVEGRVSKVSEYEDNSVLIIKNAKIDGNRTGKIRYGISLSVDGKLENVKLGSIVSFSATLYDKGVFYEDKISANSIRANVKYFASVTASEVKLVSYSPNIFQRCNNFIKDTLQKGLPEQEFSIAYAMLTGNDDFIDAYTLQNYRSAGIAHIFAVSGLHIGFLATALSFIFSKIKLNKKIAFVITLIILFLYAGICGFSASSLRAVIMCAVLLSSRILGYKYDMLSSIGVAGCVLLIFRPIELFCVGFQLSFAVVIGIAVMMVPLKRLLRFLPSKLATVLAVTLSAQIVSIPISMVCFGQFSLIAVLFNILFIPIASVIFIMLLFATVLGGIFSIQKIALFLPRFILTAVNYVVNFIDYKWFIVSAFALGVGIILYYLIIFIACGMFNLGKRLKIIACILLSLILVAYCLAINLLPRQQSKMYVIGVDSMCSSLIVSESANILVINKASSIPLSNLKRIASEDGVSTIDYVILNDALGKTDIHYLVTKLSVAFEVKHLFYYGDERVEEEESIAYFFRDIEVGNFYSEDEILLDNAKGRFLIDGNAFNLQIKNENIVFFSEMKDSPNYVGLDGDYSMLVAVDYCERIADYYLCDNVISYKSSRTYQDGQTEGRFCYKFS